MKYTQQDAEAWRSLAQHDRQHLIRCREFIDRWMAVFRVTADKDPLAMAFVLSADAVYKMTYPQSDT